MKFRLASEAESAASPAPAHAAAAADRQHRRDGRVRAAAAHPRRAGGRPTWPSTTSPSTRLRLDADRARGAARPRAAVRAHDRGRRVEGARDLRHEQRQRRRLGALRRGRDQALSAARRPARRPAAPAARAARAFLDPGLQSGTITREEAMRVLREDVVLSEAMALQEVRALHVPRARRRRPPTSTATRRLMELRAETERALGPKFDRTELPRLPARPGAAAPLAPAQGGVRGVHPPAAQKIAADLALLLLDSLIMKRSGPRSEPSSFASWHNSHPEKERRHHE